MGCVVVEVEIKGPASPSPVLEISCNSREADHTEKALTFPSVLFRCTLWYLSGECRAGNTARNSSCILVCILRSEPEFGASTSVRITSALELLFPFLMGWIVQRLFPDKNLAAQNAEMVKMEPSVVIEEGVEAGGPAEGVNGVVDSGLGRHLTQTNTVRRGGGAVANGNGSTGAVTDASVGGARRPLLSGGSEVDE